MDKKKTFDVSRPGKSSPESTSRPIIMSNRSIVKDPTLTQGDKASSDPELESANEIGKVSNHAKTVKPPAEVNDEPAAKDTEKSEVTDTPTDDAPADDEPAGKEEVEPKTEAENDVELDPTIGEKKKANKLSAEEKAHQGIVDKLVAEGKYVVPIGQVNRRRNTRNFLMVILLLLIVGVVAGDLLIDAGIIKTNIKPVVDLIKN